MIHKIVTAQRVTSLVCVWRSSSTPGTPLVCVWIQAGTAEIPPAVLEPPSTETGGLELVSYIVWRLRRAA
jgi:hypothetical protein